MKNSDSRNNGSFNLANVLKRNKELSQYGETYFIWPFFLFIIGIILLVIQLSFEFLLPLIMLCAISFFASFISLISEIINLSKRKKYYTKLNQAILNSRIEEVNNLSPFEFELWIAEIMNLAGYNAYVTQQSRDFGVDVIAEKDNYKIAIQVKKYTYPLGIKCVQEIIAGKEYYHADEGWVMSTAPKYTTQAKEQAKISNIKLFNIVDLALYLDKIKSLHNTN